MAPFPLREMALQTESQLCLVDITSMVRGVLKEIGLQEGICVVYCPHTTAAITIQENADPGLSRDLVHHLAAIFPRHGDYHHCEDNSQSHLLSSLLGASQTIPVVRGALALGTWQAIYFFELDGPRRRKVLLKFVEG